MDRVLVTGITGFAGSHLSELLLSRNEEVWGIYHRSDPAKISPKLPQSRLIKCNLLEPEKVLEAIGRIQPGRVYHLAAQSSPILSTQNPAETLRINIFSALNLFEAVLRACPSSVILNVASGEEYGEVRPEDLPVRESTELRPMNAYSVSKVAQDLLSFQYWKSSGLKVVRCRPFNHLGPRQSEKFVASAFAKQIAEVEAGLTVEKAIRVGNLESERDFLDVRDVVEAYALLMEKGAYGEVYNISSGKTVKIRHILDVLLSYSPEKIEVVQDSSRYIARETVPIRGDSSRLLSLGWVPRYRLEDSLKWLLDYWREVVRGRVAG